MQKEAIILTRSKNKKSLVDYFFAGGPGFVGNHVLESAIKKTAK